MTRPLVIVAHPDLAHSRINWAWANDLTASGAVDVYILSENLLIAEIDVRREQALLSGHDRIILQYLIHWYSAPGLLHDWLDAALKPGWAYGPGRYALAGSSSASRSPPCRPRRTTPSSAATATPSMSSPPRSRSPPSVSTCITSAATSLPASTTSPRPVERRRRCLPWL